MKDLNGKKVLLTGGSRGIGPIIAESLAKRGADIILTASSDSTLREVVTRLNKSGFSVLALPADLRDSSQREQLVIDVMKNFGTLDILINNAGLETEGAYAELSWSAIR